MTVIESLLSLPPNGRIALWAGLLLIVGFGTLRTAWRDYQGVPNPRDAAKLIESEFPQFEESLAAGLEFTTSGPPFGESVDLAVAVADQADERSLGLDIGQVLPRTSRWHRPCPATARGPGLTPAGAGPLR